MDQKRKRGILIAGAKCEAILRRNNRKFNQDGNTTVFRRNKNTSENDGKELNINNVSSSVIARNTSDNTKCA